MRHLPYNRPTDFLRRRDFGQKMNATFDFIRAHATPLVRVLVTIVLPLVLLTGIGVSLIQSQLLNTIQELISKSTAGDKEGLTVVPEVFTSPAFWLTILSGLLLFAVLHLVVIGYVVLQADRTTDEPVTAGDVWQLVKARFLGMVGSFIGLGLLFTLGFGAIGGILFALGALLETTWFAVLLIMVLYIGVIYSFVPLSIYFIVWLREGRGFFGSLVRCFKLVWGKWWSTLGIIVVISTITGLVTLLVVTVLTTLLAPFGGLTGGDATDPTGSAKVLLIVYTILSSIIRLVLYPLLLIGLSFQYFNLVELHDGTGSRLLVDAIGEPATAAPLQGLRPDDEGEY